MDIDSTRISPAEYVAQAFGGREKLAAFLGLNRVTVWRWSRPVDERGRGCNGAIPHHYQAIILRIARRDGLDITAEDLVLGRLEAPEAPAVAS
jgi:hypothetical protein